MVRTFAVTTCWMVAFALCVLGLSGVAEVRGDQWKGTLDGVTFEVVCEKGVSAAIVGKERSLEEVDPDLKDSGFSELVAMIVELPDASYQYEVAVSTHPSMDPMFSVYALDHEGKRTRAGCADGLKMRILASGEVFVEGHANADFNKHKLCMLKGGTFQEIKQPYYHVGEKTQTRKTVELFADEGMITKLRPLAKGEKITVLLSNDQRAFLVLTADGITGWAKPIIGQNEKNSDFTGMFFAGD